MCIYIYTLILPSDICPERLRTYKNLCEKENIFSSTYQVLHLLKLKDRAGKTQFRMRYPPGNCSSELQKETRISVTIVPQLVAPAWDVPALLPQYSSEKLRKDWSPSAQAPGLLASLDWRLIRKSAADHDGRANCQLNESFPSSATVIVFIHNYS